jgi:uncharacterized pyridoxal phosphate-containing UPF0001 family protein
VTSFSTGSADPADPAERPGGAPARADSRTAELSAALAAVETRIAAACSAAGRDRAGVTLVVVTKTYPGDDVARLAALGVRDVGENREQEGAAKHAECAGLGLGWHFIGQLQTNKARSVAGWADLVHSVDRSPLVAALARGAERAGRVLDCLVQVSLDGDPFAAFAVLPRLLDEVRRVAPGADVVSAGMSGDLEAAVACGATHLRVGTAILGRRPPLG